MTTPLYSPLGEVHIRVDNLYLQVGSTSDAPSQSTLWGYAHLLDSYSSNTVGLSNTVGTLSNTVGTLSNTVGSSSDSVSNSTTLWALAKYANKYGGCSIFDFEGVGSDHRTSWTSYIIPENTLTTGSFTQLVRLDCTLPPTWVPEANVYVDLSLWTLFAPVAVHKNTPNTISTWYTWEVMRGSTTVQSQTSLGYSLQDRAQVLIGKDNLLLIRGNMTGYSAVPYDSITFRVFASAETITSITLVGRSMTAWGIISSTL